MNQGKPRTWIYIAWLILLLGVLRAGSLVLAEPLVGYANQFDMMRTSACLGLWPLTADEIPREEATPAAPLNHYFTGERDAFNCLPGSESVVSGLAMLLALPLSDDLIDLRWIGGFKLLLMVLAAVMFQSAFSRHGGAALMHALVFSLVLCDPFNTLYANSLYTEYTALLGLYLALASIMAASFSERFPRPLLALWFIGLLLLGGSRVQHLLLPLALLAPAWFVMRSRAPRAWWIGLVVALTLGTAQLGLQRSSEAIGDANVVNTLFFSVLPAAQEPAELGQALGLDQQCTDLAHSSWYLTRGANHREACPGAFELSRGKMLMVLAAQPTTFATLVFRALHQSGGWRLSYVGEVANEQYGRLAGIRGFSLAGLIAAMPFLLYAVFYGLPLWPGAWTGWRLARFGSLFTPERLSLGVGFFSLALVMLITFGTSLIGDGFSEFSRHAHLSHNAAVIIWLMTPMALVRLARVYGAGALTLPLAGYAALALAIVLIARALPLASGILERPDTAYLEPGLVELSGWVADPWGVEEVHVSVGDQAPMSLDFSRSEEVGAYLPVGEIPVRFSGRYDARGAISGAELRLTVVNRRGQETVFERRRMR